MLSVAFFVFSWNLRLVWVGRIFWIIQFHPGQGHLPWARLLRSHSLRDFIINQSSLFDVNWPKLNVFFYIKLLIMQICVWLLRHPIPALTGWRRILPVIPELLQLHTPSASGFPRKSPEVPALPHSNMQKMQRKTPQFLPELC